MTLLHQAAQKAVEALKPCPFCGNAAEHRERNGGYFVQCDTCDTRTASRLRPDYAAAHWNQRESALQQQPEPVAPAEIDRDTDGELLIDWSPGPGRMVTLSLRDDGRLSYAITWDAERAHGTAQMPALQHQEEPREPVAPGLVDCGECRTQGCPAGRCRNAASPSTTRQQEVGSGREQTLAGLLKRCARCLPPEHATRKLATEYLRENGYISPLRAAAPSTPEKAGGVPAFDPTQPCLMQSHTLIGPAPTMTYCQRCKNPHHACDGGVPSPIPHPLPAQANDGGEQP